MNSDELTPYVIHHFSEGCNPDDLIYDIARENDTLATGRGDHQVDSEIRYRWQLNYLHHSWNRDDSSVACLGCGMPDRVY